MASSLSITWNRIQFTPDLLPSDVTGVSIFNQASAEFEFKPGPIFANVVLGDEINRASPKTQSALLEVMEEGTLSTDGRVYPMHRPFMVVATQNPIDMEGTYVLPEAQFDRFLMKLTVGYPSTDAEAEILRTQKTGSTVAICCRSCRRPTSGHDRRRPSASRWLRRSRSTSWRSRPQPGRCPNCGWASRRVAAWLCCGPRGPRGRGRAPFVVPEDVKAIAPVVLAHRVILQPEAELQGRTGAELIARAVQSVPVPRAVAAR